MRKSMIGLVAGVLLLGLSGAAIAATNDTGNGTFNFGQMLPYMQQVHPDLSNQDLQEMYNACHGTNGAAPSKYFQNMNPQNMMGL